MKKFTLLVCSCVIALGQSLMAQENAQEVTYVEDPSQGWLFNSFKDNWFVTAEGGAGVYLSPNASERDFMDRWEPAASIYAGKWFSPLLGVRVGVNWFKSKGLSEVAGVPGVRPDEPMINGYYKQVFSEVGPVFDVMFNVTNWACGYKPGRKYNLVVYAGGGGYWTFAKEYNEAGESKGWKNMEDRILAFRAGVINSFNVSKQVQLSLDLRFNGIDNHPNEAGYSWNKTSYSLQAYVGATYLFNKREWSHPVVPVCPEPENCNAYVARLQAADARIADLEQQLQDCLNKPEPVVEEKGPLATVYYPINVSKISRTDASVLQAVAEVMKSNPDKKYVLTGWADNYTGNDKINTRLRHNRVNGVEKYLLKCGVPASQLQSTINAGNLCDLGEKYVALDRAVTIEEAN